ncbi:hypothetical protein A33M_1493 [Rhodovulum sp. PH10]|nr:hypothetical protein A33M_1493 [Rhodovulum sp. PH10]
MFVTKPGRRHTGAPHHRRVRQRNPTPERRRGRQKKGAAGKGGPKCQQGGVKQSGQEPLGVHEVDDHGNKRESLTPAYSGLSGG